LTRSGNSVDRCVRRYRRCRTARVWGYNPWAWNAEPGDLMVCGLTGRLYRLEEPSSWPKAAAGELYPRHVKPPEAGLRAEIVNVDAPQDQWEVWWVRPPNEEVTGGE